MGIDSEDEEAGSILMSLAHKTIKNPQPTINKKNHSMSITNLINRDVTPYHSTEHIIQSQAFKKPKIASPKIRRNSIHVHLSYKIHAHKIRMQPTYSTLLYPSIPFHYKDPI